MAIPGLLATAASGGSNSLDFGSSAESGDQQTNTSKIYNFTGPSINQPDYKMFAIIGGVLLILFIANKKLKVL